MKTALTFAIGLQNDYIKKFVAARVMNIVKDIAGFELLARMRAKSYCRSILANKMMLKHEVGPALLKSLNGGYYG